MKMNIYSMKQLISKMLLFVLITVLVYSYGFAKEQVGVLDAKIFKGRVESIVLPSSSDGTKQEIVVVGEQGGRMSFLLTSGMGVYNSNWEVLSLKKIKPGDKVAVEYTTTKYTDRAISITLEDAVHGEQRL